MAFVFYDVETTGLNKRFDQILQFAAVRADVDLVETERFETRCRLMPHIVPSPKALHLTGTSLAEASDMSRQTHYSMVCEIARVLETWSPAIFLGFNSISFDEEFLRQAFYQCLHPVFLTNTNRNARADVLNLMRAAGTLHPTVIRPGVGADGADVYKLGPLAAANGIKAGRAHDAVHDVEAMLELCRLVRSGAPELWSTFLRFSSKTSVIDFVRDEDAFAYFDFYGSPRVMHFLTRVGISPRDRNVHYCLDLAGDIEALRNLEEQALAECLKVEPRPIRRLKVNGSPLLYPLWDIERPLFRDTSEEELMRTASLVRADPDFMERLTNAAAASEMVYPASEHVELQIYGAGFFSDADRELCRQFHSRSWDERLRLVEGFEDQRLRRLGRRLIYFEAPHLIVDVDRRAMDEDIAARRRGDGRHSSPPWTTVPSALAELELIRGEISEEFIQSFGSIT
ncbi:exonuclease domain-containing protein [Bradyrhizobium sp. HKCCYLS3013]|uniref:exonuclease domain-containing protein n=1 Tax=Bradyrhizobium sp. HKCCYLS3013 TaxID=3420735 RepID=UPI003EB70E96